eukprot:CAMPEP_0114556762 /NCGR_PEP_ID=MMETSP0114-20121206/9461_1 /TAXON_ID=31324 /ORGANISM="Goniomonas sp, Strain m" /LENGTH=30 /DNA_ID= /DNA_START= /DNA_END= /DNA_ORIENTATION=
MKVKGVIEFLDGAILPLYNLACSIQDWSNI